MNNADVSGNPSTVDPSLADLRLRIGVLNGTACITSVIPDIVAACQEPVGARVVREVALVQRVKHLLHLYRTEHFRRRSCFGRSDDVHGSPPRLAAESSARFATGGSTGNRLPFSEWATAITTGSAVRAVPTNLTVVRQTRKRVGKDVRRAKPNDREC